MSHHEQSEYWNDPSVAADLRSRQSGVTEFAQEVAKLIPDSSKIVELGCGAGDDAAYFASAGHDVLATDVSHTLLDLAEQRFADVPNLNFRHADISQSLSFGGQSCDVVYARLSLHYFDHRVTMSAFGEISWILRPAGLFFFACLSTEDPLYGKGREIEPDYFEYEGNTRHFFSADYASELLELNGFTQIEVTEGEQKLYGIPSAYIRASAARS